jgi:hypothetical protein
VLGLRPLPPLLPADRLSSYLWPFVESRFDNTIFGYQLISFKSCQTQEELCEFFPL